MDTPPQPSIQPIPATPAPKKEEGGAGPIIGIVVIALIIILGGAYYLLQVAPVPAAETLPTLDDAQKSSDPDVQASMSQGSSDEISDIQADLDATDFTAIDSSVSGVDANQ